MRSSCVAIVLSMAVSAVIAIGVQPAFAADKVAGVVLAGGGGTRMWPAIGGSRAAAHGYWMVGRTPC